RVTLRGRTADPQPQPAEFDVLLRLPGAAGDRIAVAVGHAVAVAGGELDAVSAAIPAAGGAAAESLQDQGAGIARIHARIHRAIAGAYAHEHLAAGQRVLHERVRRDLHRALGL